jgi:diamine N-acetyltransferase
MDAAIDVVPVTAENWRACAALRPAPGQEDFVSPVTYYLCLCAYGDVWTPWAVTRDGAVVGFAMTGRDDDGSRWIGGLLVDAALQRVGIARAAVALLRDRLAAEPGCPNVALSYAAANTAARALYVSLGFRETGETEDDGAEVVARWTPDRRGQA